MLERGRFPALTVLTAALVVLTGAAIVVVASEAARNQETHTTCENTSEEKPLVVSAEGKLLMYHYASADSTQDEARAIVSLSREELLLTIPAELSMEGRNAFNTIAVTATEQTKGRGTNGRKWMGARGNTFVTLSIRQSDWRETSLPMTLLPIKIGIVVAEQVSKLLSTTCQQQQQATEQGKVKSPADAVTIKWPNDILVNEKKIAGVLIESTSDWFMIGIGVNVAHAPTVPASGPDQGRPSTCIYCLCPGDDGDDKHSSPNPYYYVDVARELGVTMAADLAQWLGRCSDEGARWDAQEEQIRMLQQWRSFVDWDMPLVLRDSTDKQPVLPVGIEPDGRLRVRSSNGPDRLVVSDYFL